MNLLDTYRLYFRDFWPILRDMAARGVPVSEVERGELKALIEREDQRVTVAVQTLVPQELRGVEPKHGYKRTPKDLTGLVEREFQIEKEEKCSCLKKVRGSCAVCAGSGIIASGSVVRRWASPVEFNPNSSHQVKRFMRYLKHPIPKHAKRLDATGEASDTTEVKELERLFAKTKHPIYPLLIEKRQLSKMEGTYYENFKPGKDGSVHTTWTFQTATWQLSSRSPCIQNSPVRGKSPFQKTLFESFAKMLTASPRHTLVNFDYKSFHAQTTACEAGLPDYLRLAKIDIHSFNACHFIKHPERHGLLKWSDVDLKQFFKELKADPRIWTNGLTFKEIRDNKTKSAGLGIGFGMQPRKLYMMYKEDFENQKEAEAIWNLIMRELFPGLLKWHNEIKQQAAEDKKLTSRFGATRFFYDCTRWDRKRQAWVGGDQAEAAIAFLPASNAFGMIRWGMLRLKELCLLTKYRLINTKHDSLKFDCPDELVEECKAQVIPIIQAPCPIMIYPNVTGPEGLSVEVEAQVGKSDYDLH
jgi:hypothetical protein